MACIRRLIFIMSFREIKGTKDLIRLACGKPPSPEGKVAERSEVG